MIYQKKKHDDNRKIASIVARSRCRFVVVAPRRNGNVVSHIIAAAACFFRRRKTERIGRRRETKYTTTRPPPCCFDRFLWIYLDARVCVYNMKTSFFSLSLSGSFFYFARVFGDCFMGSLRRMIIKWIREFLQGHGRQEKRIYSGDAYNRPRRRRAVPVGSFFFFFSYVFIFRRSFVFCRPVSGRTLSRQIFRPETTSRPLGRGWGPSLPRAPPCGG